MNLRYFFSKLYRSKKSLVHFLQETAKKYYPFFTAQYTGEPYATHIPVLIGLARIGSVKRVLEFGMGAYSTFAFLNKKLFPDLAELHSFEDNRTWFEEITSVIEDGRWKSHLCAPPLSKVVSEIDFQGFDLVLIDDSTTVEDRCNTISEVLKFCDPNTLVVIHDYEQLSYQNAANLWPHKFNFRSLYPNTGVIWDKRKVSRMKLLFLNLTIARHIKLTAYNQYELWLEVLR